MTDAAKIAEGLTPAQRKAVFPIADGDVTIIFPENMSGESWRLLSRYLDVLIGEEVEAAGRAVAAELGE